MSWQPHDPPKVPDERNAAIAALGYNRFPHLFLELARRFDVLHEFLTVLLYLWDATVGQAQFVDGEKIDRNPQGRISRSQFPAAVRNKQRDKWLAALCASGLFNLLEKAPPESRVGSLYEYVQESTTEDWVRFFGMVRLAKWFRGDKDKKGFTPARFARMFTPHALHSWLDENGNSVGLPKGEK
ncbi:MAG: hypothetical protein WA182_06885 [Candidatus Sulfotelmatobacter sp.]